MPVAVTDGRPMCLRTHRWLGDDTMTVAGEYLCPGFDERCSGGETYQMQTAETEAGASVFNALVFGLVEFPTRQQPAEMAMWLIRENGSKGPIHLRPESPWDQLGRRAVYLNGSNRFQLAFQAAHEVFHVLWTPEGILHWSHEVGAMIFSIRHLDGLGATDMMFRTHRANQIEAATEGARDYPLLNLMCAEQPYPEGFYDRAILFGLQLIDIVGPAGYQGIAKLGPTGRPDFWGWVDSKPVKLRHRIESIAPPREGTV